MSEFAYFYNSENGDRQYDADSFSEWLRKFFTTGVFEGDCQCTSLGGMVIQAATGYANIMGKVKFFAENTSFTLEPADGMYPRIDTLVIERNDTDRDITVKVVTGQLSGNDPVPTARVWENGVYQLIVAEIYVAAGATEVTQANITDKRSDPDVCGIVAGTVTEMDFSQFTAQFEAYFAEFQASNLDEFEVWFQHMKDQLDTDAAGHLQNEIDALSRSVDTQLAGYTFHPSGSIDLVALIADDSYYLDNNNKYVLADSPTGQQMIEDEPSTYKSLASDTDLYGIEGEDTVSGFEPSCTPITVGGVTMSTIDDKLNFLIEGLPLTPKFEDLGLTYFATVAPGKMALIYLFGIYVNSANRPPSTDDMSVTNAIMQRKLRHNPYGYSYTYELFAFCDNSAGDSEVTVTFNGVEGVSQPNIQRILLNLNDD